MIEGGEKANAIPDRRSPRPRIVTDNLLSIDAVTLKEAIRVLVRGDGSTRSVIDTRGLRTLFNRDSDAAFNKGLRTLVECGLHERFAPGVYCNHGAPRLGDRRFGVGGDLGGMRQAGLLRHLVFKGGTCLRLCYGSQRFSEDLDFSGGTAFTPTLLPVAP